MVVIIVESATPSLRGELTRWLIEPHAGVFVGHLSGIVRDKLWLKCCQSIRQGGVLMLWSTNNEQRYKMQMFGATRRKIVDFDGLQLIRVSLDED